MLLYFYVQAFTFSINSNTVPTFDKQMIFVKSTLKEINDIKQDPYILKHKNWLYFARLGYTQTLNAIKSSVENTEQKLLIEALDNFWIKIIKDYQDGLNLLDLKMINLHYVFILSNTEKNRNLLESHRDNGFSGINSQNFFKLMYQNFSEVSFEQYVYTGGFINKLSNPFCFCITFYCDDDGEFNVNNFLECFFGEFCFFISTLPSKAVNTLNVLPHTSKDIGIQFLFYFHDLFHERAFTQKIVSDLFKKEKLNDLSFYDFLKEDFIQYKHIPERVILIFSIIHDELGIDIHRFLFRENEDYVLFLNNSYESFKNDRLPFLGHAQIPETKKSLLNSMELLLQTSNEDKKTKFYARLLLGLHKIGIHSTLDYYTETAARELSYFFEYSSIKEKYNYFGEDSILYFDHKKSQFFYKEEEEITYINTSYKILTQDKNIDKTITISLFFELVDSQKDTALSRALKSYFQDINNKQIPLTIFYPHELNSALNDFYPVTCDRSNFLDEDQLQKTLILFKNSIFLWLDPKNTFRNILNQECEKDTKKLVIEQALKDLNLKSIEGIKNQVREIFKKIQKEHTSLADKIVYINLQDLSLNEKDQEIFKTIIQHKYGKEKDLNTLLQKADKIGTHLIYLDQIELYEKILSDFNLLFLKYKQETIENNKLQIRKNIKHLINNFNNLNFF